MFGNKILLIIVICSIDLFSQSYFEESSNLALDFYSSIVSDVKNDVSKCQFYPSCSMFARESISEFGFLKGMILTGDRFLRCSGGHLERGSYPRINGLFYDPPIKNFIFGEGNLWNFGITSSTIKEDEVIPDSLFLFPKKLFDNKKYDLSILELERVNFYSKEIDKIQKTLLLIAVNYFKMQNSNSAMETLNKVSFIDEYMEVQLNTLKFIINDLENTNRWNSNFFSKQIDDSPNINKYKQFQIYSLFKLKEFEEIEKNLNKLNDSNITIELRILIENQNNLPYKSPLLAGIMSSIIPGSGYLYAGHTKEALSAFVVNILFGSGIYYLFKNENYSSGILTTMVAAPFYLGNIIGSANSAQLYNNKIDQFEYLKLRKILNLEFEFSNDFLNSLW